ncbi:hypothetical protein ACFOJ6_03570 [Gordonia humi]|uniref:hypothetical protein n=1 Tax=Gordonia humi TaxID=686429 RepID=UPI003610F1DF
MNDHARWSTRVHTAAYDDATSTWTVSIGPADGDRPVETLTADAVISAVGLLNEPSIPRIPGLDAFDGPALHTARWDDSIDLAGKRVAVIGTGGPARCSSSPPHPRPRIGSPSSSGLRSGRCRIR